MEKVFQDRLAVIFTLFLCLILYFNSLGNPFIFDDLHTVKDNLLIKEARYIPLLFKGYYTSRVDISPGMFRPLLLLTFSFNYLFNGLNPFSYRFVNILLHFLNGILLYLLLRFLKRDLPFGLVLFTTLLFIAHPINTEAVNYITCRSDLVITLFIVLAFISYAKGRLFLPLFLYILALLTKETSLVFPPLIFAYDFIYRKDAKAFEDTKKNLFIFYMFLIGLTVLYWVYRQSLFGSGASILAPLSSPLRSFRSNILIQSVVTLFYLKLFIWPYPLNIHHTFPELNSLFNPLAVFCIIGIIIIIVFIFILRKKEPLISLGLAWYLICLIPKFYAILNVVAGEHHFYLPSIGIYIILSISLSKFYLKFHKQFIYLFSCILIIFSFLVWFRNYEWKDSFTLWQSALKRAPNSAIASNSLGVDYLNRGEFIKAEEYFKKALSLSNTLTIQITARLNLANVLTQQKRFDEAKKVLDEALNLAPNYFTVYESLGSVYMNMGDEEKAEEIWKKGLTLCSYAASIHQKLGMFYLERNKIKEAKYHFELTIKSDPERYLAYFGLGLIMEKRGDIKSATELYKKATRLTPTYAPAHYHLGTLYAEKGNPKALWHLKEAIRLNPNFAEAHNNLAVLYALMEPPQLELARQHAKRALSLGYEVNKEFLKIIDLPPSQ